MPPEMSGIEVLRFLMERDDLRQAKALVVRFGVPIALFVP